MRIVLTFLLLMAAAPARAEWVEVGKSSKSAFSFLSRDAAYYIDPASITREGNFRRVWEIHDLAEKGSQGERSVLASVEYDCADNRMRTLKATGRSQRMARGEILPLSRVLDEWIILRPGGADEIFFRILKTVCAP
jgi:Surface-adhesin protein E